MGFVMPHMTVLIGAGAVGLALLLQIIGVATPGWVTGEGYDIRTGRRVDTGVGLWQACIDGNCGDIPFTTAWLDASRAFGILGVLAMAAALAFALLICFMSERKNLFGLIAPMAAAAGAFCALIEFAVYAGESKATSFGYSFALTIVACILSAVAAVLFFLGRSRNQ